MYVIMSENAGQREAVELARHIPSESIPTGSAERAQYVATTGYKVSAGECKKRFRACAG
jgi:hypothetical protein